MYKDVIYDNNNIKDEVGNYIEVDFSMLLKPHTPSPFDPHFFKIIKKELKS